MDRARGLLVLLLGVALGATLLESPRSAVAARQLYAIHGAIEFYRANRGELPGYHGPVDQSQAALYQALVGGAGSYLAWSDDDVGVDDAGRPVLLDPWGRPFGYWVDHAGYDLASAGPNGVFEWGGADWRQSDDLGYWLDRGWLDRPQHRRAWVLFVGLALVAGSLASFVLGRWAWRRRQPPPPLPVRVAARGCPWRRCAWCHDHDPIEQLSGCERCGVTLHPDCWSLSPRCPTLGCAPRRRRVVIWAG